MTPLSLFCVALLCSAASASAQSRPLPPIPAAGHQPVKDAQAALSGNFRFTLSGTKGETTLGELSVLSCSPRLSVSGPLDASDFPTQFTVDGTITEQGELLRFDFAIGFQVAMVSSQMTTATPPVAVSKNIQWHQHQCEGSLLMKPGKSYEVLKAAGVTYSLVLVPEEDQ